ncbi:hypothetical protein NLX83_18860 [Allokutzneria sp. A3M-2-11 16]|uniref:hypothetical protein n=1 Tax=Allokutzneria sp. A3M-2-11 16 TaxID=2962043 RepID=UPI0020B73BAD|nr:hypothetical protein [Allokutzneria sp. A3M-2-11 16]MCP3801325.1 hypothetical protein [Allokutzneria sp. A3M-2-11 16]
MVPLDLLSPELARRRALVVGLTGGLVAALLGVLVALLLDATAGLVLFVVLALPPSLLAFAESRKRSWLDGRVLTVRGLGTTSADLAEVTDLGVLVSQAKGLRTVSLLVTAGGKTISVALAIYAEDRLRELEPLALRKLADALNATGQPHALLFAELLVAQLRAEAREAALDERPLFTLAAAAEPGKLAQRIAPEVVSKLVASL